MQSSGGAKMHHGIMEPFGSTKSVLGRVHKYIYSMAGAFD